MSAVSVVKKLWQEEPVLVAGLLSLATSAGVLSATEASAVGDAVAAVVNFVALLLARRQVKPAKGA